MEAEPEPSHNVTEVRGIWFRKRLARKCRYGAGWSDSLRLSGGLFFGPRACPEDDRPGMTIVVPIASIPRNYTDGESGETLVGSSCDPSLNNAEVVSSTLTSPTRHGPGQRRIGLAKTDDLRVPRPRGGRGNPLFLPDGMSATAMQVPACWHVMPSHSQSDRPRGLWSTVELIGPTLSGSGAHDERCHCDGSRENRQMARDSGGVLRHLASWTPSQPSAAGICGHNRPTPAVDVRRNGHRALLACPGAGPAAFCR